MILHKLAGAIRRQDWFQVVIEVLIVIVGIFLGLQVQAWYEEQGERADEARYLVRLHADVERTTLVGDMVGGDTNNIKVSLNELSNLLIEGIAVDQFTDAHCQAITFSHVYLNPLVSSPTINELLSSGQILLIENEDLRTAIADYYSQLESVTAILGSLHGDKLDIARKYPEIVTLISTNNAIPIPEDYEVRCNFSLMVDDVQFRNDLISNTTRYNNYLRAITRQLDALHLLHQSLDQELELLH
tara:strand:+ start:127 stop:858 length:732 start_codon:yes stop_codon:yes gene_type:complete